MFKESSHLGAFRDALDTFARVIENARLTPVNKTIARRKGSSKKPIKAILKQAHIFNLNRREQYLVRRLKKTSSPSTTPSPRGRAPSRKSPPKRSKYPTPTNTPSPRSRSSSRSSPRSPYATPTTSLSPPSKRGSIYNKGNVTPATIPPRSPVDVINPVTYNMSANEEDDESWLYINPLL